MKCPFELPVKTEVSPVDPDLRYVASVGRSKVGYIFGVFGDCNKKYADYIVHVINSHEKLVEALKKYGDHEPCCVKGDGCNCGFEKALKEAEKP